MRDVRADLARFGQPDHRIQIGPVQIDLTAEFMGDIADFAHRFLEHPMGRGIGDHAGRQTLARRLGLGAEILQINVAVLGTFHHTTSIPAICAEAGLVPWAFTGSGRCRAVRRHWRGDMRRWSEARHIRPERRNWAASTSRHSR